MRNLIVTEFLSLDGVMEEPRWTAPYWNHEIAEIKQAESLASSALLMGRVTYEGFASAWPNSTDEGADLMNSLPKHVVSSTLTSLEWNNSSLLVGDVARQVRQLKEGRLMEGTGSDILVYGSAMLVQTLMAHGLVDLYRLLVYPVVVGGGKRLFSGPTPATLRLTESRTFSSGVVMLCYAPERAPQTG